MQKIHAKNWEDGYKNTSESYFSLLSKTSYELGNQILIPGRGRDCSHWYHVDEYGNHSASHQGWVQEVLDFEIKKLQHEAKGTSAPSGELTNV